MLDPRIYRTGLLAVVLAVIVFAFALKGQGAPLGATLAPIAFNGSNARKNMVDLARQYPHRRAGSAADRALARVIAERLRGYGYPVSHERFSAATPAGTRTLENVVAVRLGMSSSAIVVVANRDAVGSPAVAEQSGTAVLLELARVLAGETLNHTIALVSTSGSLGAAGAAHLAATLGEPIDAVLVLGNMAGARLSRPLVVPWSNGTQIAPTELRDTATAALRAQAGLTAGNPGLGAQLAHLAFPLTLTEQGPFGAHGIPAVLLSSSGAEPPSASEPINPVYPGRFGRTALQIINALNSSRRVPAPSAYLSLDGNEVPAWVVRLLVLALILPVAATAVDGLARARRRRYAVARPLASVAAAAAPFLAALAVILVTRAAGLLDFAPPGPLGPGAAPLRTGGVALLAGLGAIIVASFAALAARGALSPLTGSASRRGAGRKRGDENHPPLRGKVVPLRREDTVGDPGAVAAILISSCALVLVIACTNPFAALLLVPALHLWMVAVAPDAPIPRGLRVALLALGFVLPALLMTYYALTLDFGPVSLAWTVVLMVAGGSLGVPAAVVICLLAGCGVSAAVNVIATALAPAPVKRATPITVRGPLTYAGPGSLGGTPSALPGARSAIGR